MAKRVEVKGETSEGLEGTPEKEAKLSQLSLKIEVAMRGKSLIFNLPVFGSPSQRCLSSF